MKAFGKIWVLYDQTKKKKSKPLTVVQAQATILSLMTKDPTRYCIWTPGWKGWVPLDKFLESDQTYFMITPSEDVLHADATRVTMKTEGAAVLHDDDRTMILSELTATITEMVYTKVAAVAELPPKGSDYGYYHPDFKAEEIDLKMKPGVVFNPPNSDPDNERRGDTRHNFKIEVIIVSKKGKTFKTFSDNLSISGTLLQDPIPRDFLNAPFDLIIVNRFEPNLKRGRLHFHGKVVGDFRDPRRLSFSNPEEVVLKQLDSLIKAYLSYQTSMQRPIEIKAPKDDKTVVINDTKPSKGPKKVG